MYITNVIPNTVSVVFICDLYIMATVLLLLHINVILHSQRN